MVNTCTVKYVKTILDKLNLLNRFFFFFFFGAVAVMGCAHFPNSAINFRNRNHASIVSLQRQKNK